MVCKRVHYRGNVQGVGFRMTAQRISRQHSVTGFVRNLPDGQVELVACGEPAEVERFLGAVAARMDAYIMECKVGDEPEQAYSSFDIRA